MFLVQRGVGRRISRGALWNAAQRFTMVKEQGMGNAATSRSEGSFTVIGTTLNQRFTLEKELGRGGMGAVYRATDQVLHRTVAIKMLKEHTGDEVGRKIRLEAQILARLVHDNIVRLYDFGESDGIYYLVMEEVDGSSFQRRWKHLPLAERLRICAQVAEALDYAHHQGVIHRDVKPANVLLTSTDQAKLSDFGLSKIAEHGDESGTVKGTPHYMSPEQAGEAARPPDRPVFAGGHALRVRGGGTAVPGAAAGGDRQHVRGVPEPPRLATPDPPALEALILRLLAKDPADRSASGQVVAAGAPRGDRATPIGRWIRIVPRHGRRATEAEIGPIVNDAPRQVSAATPTIAAQAPVLAKAPGPPSVGDVHHALARGAAGDAAAGPRDAGGGPGRADHALARRALSLRPLSRLPARRGAAAGVLAPPQARPPQRRPRPAAAGDDGGWSPTPRNRTRPRRSRGRPSCWRCATTSAPCSTRWSS